MLLAGTSEMSEDLPAVSSFLSPGCSLSGIPYPASLLLDFYSDTLGGHYPAHPFSWLPTLSPPLFFSSKLFFPPFGFWC